ncbi:hypothetical protein FQN52_008972 [Onygenales sp. PD_12]|nr:hypothetical protein FQN52_008972 [Onygenales sp. PD_12]
MRPETTDLLPSPWTNYTPPLRNPFASGSLPRSPATNSPPCSPDSSPTSTSRRRRFSASLSLNRMRSRSGSPFTMRSASASSSFRLSSLILRRRPSAVDLALSEERCRCSEDAVEKIGLAMMEPRPVDPMPVPVPVMMMDMDMDTDMNMDRMLDFEAEGVHNNNNNNYYVDALRIGSQPRFVMGGIFEVMEGTA